MTKRLLKFCTAALVASGAALAAGIAIETFGAPAPQADAWSPWAEIDDAPSFEGATGWINSPPQSLAGLRGKVVLVDFWTSSCDNCMRTLPYLRDWAQKYRGQGLVVIGVHTPALAFERGTEELQRITRALGITYPVAVDNGHKVWRAFGNPAWPGFYFIDHRGRIVDIRYGEGAYEDSERVLQALLREAGAESVPTDLVKPPGFDSPTGASIDATKAPGMSLSVRNIARRS